MPLADACRARRPAPSSGARPATLPQGSAHEARRTPRARPGSAPARRLEDQRTGRSRCRPAPRRTQRKSASPWPSGTLLPPRLRSLMCTPRSTGRERAHVGGEVVAQRRGVADVVVGAQRRMGRPPRSSGAIVAGRQSLSRAIATPSRHPRGRAAAAARRAARPSPARCESSHVSSTGTRIARMPTPAALLDQRRRARSTLRARSSAGTRTNGCAMK